LRPPHTSDTLPPEIWSKAGEKQENKQWNSGTELEENPQGIKSLEDIDVGYSMGVCLQCFIVIIMMHCI
jgi:hypothetical protein